jgi:predicted esterase
LASFISSQGPDDIAKNIADKAKKCPNMKFVVTGYSQGGSVAASGLAKVVKNGNADKVIAVVFYAPFGNAAPPKEFKTRQLIHCAQGDPVSLNLSEMLLDTFSNNLLQVCLNGADQSKHISYNTKGSPYHEMTAKFIAEHWNKLKGT